MAEKMKLALSRYDRTAALLDGSIVMEDVEVMPQPGPFKDIFAAWDAVLSGEMDAVEIPLGGYVLWRDKGHPVTGIPVFPDKLFVQQYIYVLRDSDVKSLADLRGRKVCVPQYNMSSSFWHRDTLKDDYGITPQEIHWVTLMNEAWPSGTPEGVTVELVRPETGPRYSGIDLMVNGTVDCVLHEGVPKMTSEEAPKVKRIHDDVHTVQRDYYKRTGFHVPTHLVIARDESLARRPDLGEVICEGFDRAKAEVYAMLGDERRVSLPLMRHYIEETVELFGNDPWSDGFEDNRPVLEKFLELAVDQGLSKKRFTPEELFDKRASAYKFKARMTGAGL